MICRRTSHLLGLSLALVQWSLTQAAHAQRRIEPTAGAGYLVADIHTGYRGFSDRRRLDDTSAAGLLGLTVHGGTAEPLGWLVAFDTDLGVGTTDGFVYDLGLRGGPAWAVSEHVLIGITAGAGVMGITDDRVPAAFELPIELVVAWGIEPEIGYRSPPMILFEAWFRQSWMFGAEERKEGSNLPWVDEMRAGLRVGVQAKRRAKGDWFRLSVVTQCAYHELMGTEGVLVTGGVGAVIFDGWRH